MPVITRSQSALIMKGLFITVRDLIIQIAKIWKMIETSTNTEEKKILFDLLSITSKSWFELQRDYPNEVNGILSQIKADDINEAEIFDCEDCNKTICGRKKCYVVRCLNVNVCANCYDKAEANNWWA